MEHAFIDGAYNDLNILHSPENVRMLGNFDAESIAAYYGLKEKPSDLLSGTYVISTAMYRSQVLDVDHASTEDYATTFL